ncbi:hypothetical protein ACT00Z_11530 [Bacillus stercoris]|uniref:hypothetical protein n=1 Tax=Bacillus stercoris TaxID=2054641 RepID=UPI004034387E
MSGSKFVGQLKQNNVQINNLKELFSQTDKHMVTHEQKLTDQVSEFMEYQNYELQKHTGDKLNPHDVTKLQVGLGNVLDVEQASKSEFNGHVNNTNNPHKVTKAQVGLDNVVNIQQASKNEFTTHVNDKTAHITIDERNKWNTTLDTANTTMENYVNGEITKLNLELVKGLDGCKYRIIAGTIRNSGSGWQVIGDSAHKSVNIASVSIPSENEYKLQVNYGLTGKTISSIIIGADETFAKYGVIAGASVSKNSHFIEMAAPFFAKVIGTSVLSAASKYHKNDIVITSKEDKSGYIIKHATMPSVDVVSAQFSQDTVPSYGGELRTVSTASQIDVTYYENIHGYIRYFNGAWEINSNNISPATISWDSTYNALRVTHNQISNIYNFHMTNSGNLNPYVYSLNTTSALIRFKDNSGNLITSPSEDMKIIFFDFAKVPSLLPSGSVTKISRGYVPIKPENMVESYGNFWIFGITEV